MSNDEEARKAKKARVKKLRKLVETDKNINLNINVQDGVINVHGNKPIMDILKEDCRAMTIGDILLHMMNLEDQDVPEKFVLDEFEEKTVLLPKLPVKFMSKKWNAIVARETLKTFMNQLGFYRGSDKSYVAKEDKPEGWPDSVGFGSKKKKHATSYKLHEINAIIKSMLEYRDIDPFKWHVDVDNQDQDMENNVVEAELVATVVTSSSTEKRKAREEEETSDSGVPVVIAVHNGQDIVFNDDLNLELEPDTETETSHCNVQTDSQVSSASEEILFHGKSAKKRKTVKSRENMEETDSDSSDDLEYLEDLAQQVSDIDSDTDDERGTPRINPYVQSTFDKILQDTLFGPRQ